MAVASGWTFPTVPDTDTASALRVAVARIHRVLRTRHDLNLTLTQGSALSRIDQEGPLRIGVLAHREGVAPASMSAIVETLETRGLIERTADESDGRASRVRVSGTGRDMLSRIRTTGTFALHRALATLDARELEQLRMALPVLERLSERLQATESEA